MWIKPLSSCWIRWKVLVKCVPYLNKPSFSFTAPSGCVFSPYCNFLCVCVCVCVSPRQQHLPYWKMPWGLCALLWAWKCKCLLSSPSLCLSAGQIRAAMHQTARLRPQPAQPVFTSEERQQAERETTNRRVRPAVGRCDLSLHAWHTLVWWERFVFIMPHCCDTPNTNTCILMLFHSWGR